MRIGPGDLEAEDVADLLREHLSDMHAMYPAESVHALDLDALRDPSITFVTARDDDGALLACGALKQLGPDAGELKTMRTTTAARGRGVGTAVLLHLLEVARANGCATVHLETGTIDYFTPARRLYARHGFVESGPFGDYRPSSEAAYMTLRLDPS